MPDDVCDETLKIGVVVGKKYRVIQQLGQGGCGSVYKVEDIEDKTKQYAMKVEFNSNANAGNVLKMEVQILTHLVSKNHVAKCMASGKKDRYSYVVMTLLGESLESLMKKHGPFFNVSTQMRIGICLLFGIKQIHDIGFIHRDLKPANVALGNKGSPDERYFIVLDFGLARQYITDKEDGKKMRRPREKALFRGTSRYCSVAMHDRFEQGRVDDLWALIYMLAELRCQLAWSDLDDKVEIGEMKRHVADQNLFAKSPIQMLEFVKIVRATQFYHRPDYEKLFNLLNDAMKSAKYKWSDPYHWEPEKRKKKPSVPAVGNVPRKGVTPPSNEEVDFFTVDDFNTNPLGF
ncbi:Protein kinase domain-containing protein [Caenorhabditis elegans]|uniref:Protein kinase domain-containing protein n=1 Tax=Caenorhabditis elegans TaxID=6239 RepID=O17693_CAEEL|nr:Protein kinase domain-containing protein [Caenorhabditis elegans]CAB03982.1 Protein kinase domain-containing protein [Caenorhabditis elegans]|eukprot:NP_506600.1 Uncharacterized protein CELE_C53A5.4 [Caenorhabditis elegans]